MHILPHIDLMTRIGDHKLKYLHMFADPSRKFRLSFLDPDRKSEDFGKEQLTLAQQQGR
jgi:hypothetical protein